MYLAVVRAGCVCEWRVESREEERREEGERRVEWSDV